MPNIKKSIKRVKSVIPKYNEQEQDLILFDPISDVVFSTNTTSMLPRLPKAGEKMDIAFASKEDISKGSIDDEIMIKGFEIVEDSEYLQNMIKNAKQGLN